MSADDPLQSAYKEAIAGKLRHQDAEARRAQQQRADDLALQGVIDSFLAAMRSAGDPGISEVLVADEVRIRPSKWVGNVQVRESRDLTNWQPVQGWLLWEIVTHGPDRGPGWSTGGSSTTTYTYLTDDGRFASGTDPASLMRGSEKPSGGADTCEKLARRFAEIMLSFGVDPTDSSTPDVASSRDDEQSRISNLSGHIAAFTRLMAMHANPGTQSIAVLGRPRPNLISRVSGGRLGVQYQRVARSRRGRSNLKYSPFTEYELDTWELGSEPFSAGEHNYLESGSVQMYLAPSGALYTRLHKNISRDEPKAGVYELGSSRFVGRELTLANDGLPGALRRLEDRIPGSIDEILAANGLTFA